MRQEERRREMHKIPPDENHPAWMFWKWSTDNQDWLRSTFTTGGGFFLKGQWDAHKRRKAAKEERQSYEQEAEQSELEPGYRRMRPKHRRRDE
jgi:hypothetical protein